MSFVDTIMLREKIDEIRSYYVYHHLKFNTNVERIWNYIDAILDYVRPAKDVDTNRGKELTAFSLSKIIMLCVWITLLRSKRLDYGDRLEANKKLHPEVWRYAHTVMYVETHVKEACIKDGLLQNREEVAAILFSRIESRIHSYGPVRFMDHMLVEYKKTFDASTEMFNRLINTTRKFLYHVALKIVTSTDVPEGTGYPETLMAIERIASVLLDLYDYRIENQFQLMFIGDPIPYFQKAVFHDALYKDYQYPPESTIIMLDSILDSYRETIVEAFGMDKEAIILISSEILSIAPLALKTEGPLLRLTASGLYKRLRKQVTWDVIITYLNRISSSTSLNSNFNRPLEVVGIDADSEWLVPVPAKEYEYFMPLPSIDCFGLYDKMKGLLGHPRSWGTVFEQFIQQWMATHLGEPVYSGDYVHEGEKGESDGICIVSNRLSYWKAKSSR
ncbi:hypothetical protein [Paenibacillus sp. sgz302251]|uniref:hypothetical protein n=1 Tax=Paenibacillus sp. sgz302251 TaxID=3414493 RepID=UPI003C7E49AC